MYMSPTPPAVPFVCSNEDLGDELEADLVRIASLTDEEVDESEPDNKSKAAARMREEMQRDPQGYLERFNARGHCEQMIVPSAMRIPDDLR